MNLLDKCNNRYFAINNKEPSYHQVTELIQMIDRIISDNNGDHYSNEMYEAHVDLMRREEAELKRKLDEEEISRLQEIQDKQEADLQRQVEVEKKHQEELQREAAAQAERLRRLQEEEERQRKIVEENKKQLEELRRQEEEQRRINEERLRLFNSIIINMFLLNHHICLPVSKYLFMNCIFISVIIIARTSL